jgi:hypothetical protein
LGKMAITFGLVPQIIRPIHSSKRIRLQMKGPRREVEPRRGPPPNNHLGGSRWAAIIIITRA